MDPLGIGRGSPVALAYDVDRVKKEVLGDKTLSITLSPKKKVTRTWLG